MKLNVIPKEVNVLYVEDDNELVKMMTEELNSTRHTKFNITVRRTLKEALKYIDKECSSEDNCNIDVILLDLKLPNSRGVNTFIKVKEKVNFIPIVIISEHEDIACKCVNLGAQDYLVKPDIPANLLIRSLKYSITRNDIERKMRNVITTSTLGYHMYELVDDKLIFTGYNPASDKILGVDNSQFIGKELNEAFPGISSLVEKQYRDALNGIPWENQHVKYKNSQIHEATFRVNAYRTAKNFLTVTFEDITGKMKIKEDLAKTLEEYKMLVEVTGAGIYGIDFINDKFTYVNDVMCKQLGYTKEELLALGPSDILTNASINKWMERFASLKRGEYIDDTVEYEAIKKDGSTMFVLVTAKYIEDAKKNIIGANVVAIDITGKKLAEQALERKEIEVFTELERKIQDWKTEISIKHDENENQLQLIDAEIMSLNGGKVEVF